MGVASRSHSRPAVAGGIYSANLWKFTVVGLDSRFRGNDRRLEWIPIPNDTSTKASQGFARIDYARYSLYDSKFEICAAS